MQWRFTSRGWFSAAARQWQPTRTTHDPNPPITLENPPSAPSLTPGLYAPGSTIYAPTVQTLSPPRYAKPLNPQIDRKSAIGRSVIHAWEFAGPDHRDGALVPDIGAYGNARALTITDRVSGSATYVNNRHGRFLDLALSHRAESTTAPAEQWWAGRYFTVELFFRVNDEATTLNPQIGLFWQPINNQNDSVVEFGYNDTWYFGVRDASNLYCFPNGNGVASNGDYVHAILTCNGTNLRFYLNGRLATNGNLNLGTSDGVNSFSTNTAIATGTPTNIGIGSGQIGGVYQNHIGFEISHARIYDRPLTSAEIALLNTDPWAPVRPRVVNSFDDLVVPALFPHLEPSIYAPGSTIYAPTVTQSSASQDINPPLYAPGSTLHVPTVTVGDVTLSPGLYTPGSTIYSPTVTVGAVSVSPPVYAPGSTFFTPRIDLNVSPDLYSPGSTIHAPTVTVGAVSVTPGLYSPGSTLYAPTVTVGAVTVNPPLYAPGSTLYTPTVDVGGATLQVPVYSPGSTIHAPTVTVGAVDISPALYAPGSTLHTPTVVPGAVSLTPGTYAPGSTIYSPSVNYVVAPGTYAPGSTIHNPTVTVGAVTVAPGLFAPGSTIHTPVVTTGAVSVQPSLFAPGSTIYSPQVFASQFVNVPVYAPGSTVYSPSVTVGDVVLAPGLFAPGGIFYSPTVTTGPVSIFASLFAPGSVIYNPTVVLPTAVVPSLIPYINAPAIANSYELAPNAPNSTELAPVQVLRVGPETPRVSVQEIVPLPPTVVE